MQTGHICGQMNDTAQGRGAGFGTMCNAFLLLKCAKPFHTYTAFPERTESMITKGKIATLICRGSGLG